VAPGTDELAAALAELRRGGVVAIPTESSYGLAADATSQEALARIFALKQRPPDRSVPLIIAGEDQLPLVTPGPIPDAARQLMARYWPGPLTLVLPAASSLAELAVLDGTVAVRVCAHPLARELARSLGRPLSATSANRSGEPPLLSPEALRSELGAGLTIVDGGLLGGGPPSTIVAFLATGELKVLRQGKVVL
jgi:L-threonylcarbamoyladenylate synthase